MLRRALATAALAVGAVLTLPSARPALAQDYAAILAQPDRSEADRKTDQTRRSELFLAFAGVTTGMKVLDVSSGGGYTMDLLARTVGPTGAVYAQDTPQGAERSKDRIEARLKSPALAKVVRLVRPFDDPVPAELRDLDLITLYYNYHDIAFLEVDRARMNRALFGALKPGGILVIADHSAQPGAGVTVARSLHRIEEATLRQEVEAAGFKLVGEADYLRNPEDKRDVVIFRSPVPVDAFVHRYEKPR
jgi:predicted methyltransferase